MHCHTSRHSPCSIVDPATLVAHARSKGLQGVVLTEHHYLWTADEIVELKKKVGLDDFFHILSAQEVVTDAGHILVFGAAKTIRNELTLDELRSYYPAALLVWAHPFRYGKRPAIEDLLNSRLDAIEIFNANHKASENYFGLRMWHRCKFKAVSGSDAHAADTVGAFPTLFDHPVKTIEELIEEVRAGRARPFYKEIPREGENAFVTELVLGTKGETEKRCRLVSKQPKSAAQWRKMKRSAAIATAIRAKGFDRGGARVPEVLETNDREMFILEEGQRGKSLFELLKNVSPDVGRSYFILAARWLAVLHKKRMRISGADYTVKRERKRFAYYRRAFESTGNRYLNEAKKLLSFIRDFEENLFGPETDSFIQIHGDYHPKNIIIGQDKMHDIGTLYVSVVDFEQSLLFVPEFDLGYFISQYRYQFMDYPEIRGRITDHDFYSFYYEFLDENDDVQKKRAVDAFRIRANMSIAAYLIKVGKGVSEDMTAVMSDSMRLLEASN